MSEKTSVVLMLLTTIACIPVARRFLQHQGLDFGYAINVHSPCK
jgi:hypothetical protein